MTASKSLAAVEKSVIEKSFKLFVKNAWPHADNAKFKANWHIDALCDHLQAVAEGKIKRLLINIPPGTAKSLIVSVLYPVWVWTTQPSKTFISTSYAMELATRDARRSRNLLESEWYQARWPIKLVGDQNQKINFENVKGGSRVAKPFQSMTGGRANLVIIDDPHSVRMANSEADRTSAVETFLEAIPNRINDPENDAIIVIMQRLHEEDISGIILERPELGYEHLIIPMEYEGANEPTSIGWTDPRTVDGELLFPNHMTPSAIAKLKSSLGPVAYAGQYQQRPAPREAGLLDVRWFNRYKLGKHPEGCNYYMTSDHAPSGKGDYNVFRVWGIDHERNLWLVDSFRKRCLMDEAFGIKRVDGKYRMLGNGALPMIRKWSPYAFFPEKDSAWITIESLFKSALRETSTHVRIDPQPISGLGDKTNKVQPYIAVASLGQVYIPEGPMGDDTLAEYGRFPNGKHDDQVDADGMIARVLVKLITGTAKEPPKQPIDFLEYADNDNLSADSYY